MEFPLNWIRLNCAIWAFFLEAYSFTLQQKKTPKQTKTNTHTKKNPNHQFSAKKSVFPFVNVPCPGIGNVCQSVTYGLVLTGDAGWPLTSQWVRRQCRDADPRQRPYMQKESDHLPKSGLYLASWWQAALAAVGWMDWIVWQLCLRSRGNMDPPEHSEGKKLCQVETEKELEIKIYLRPPLL